MDMVGTVKSGTYGERIAALYLSLAGYRILETNYRSGHLEIDLIADKSDCLTFIEVKTRRSVSYGSAVESIDRRKLSRLRRAARGYLAENPPQRGYNSYRFDLVAIDLDLKNGTMLLRHLKGIV
ncbi:MAG: YraN family protein [Candidatus Krumholzibacteria bacterium]|nr:YraN family protein [Candidatus Krumholzibacteria bacterium]